MTMKTDGADDRSDPGEGFTMGCLIKEHGEHRVVRISPDDYEELTKDDYDYDDDIDEV